MQANSSVNNSATGISETDWQDARRDRDPEARNRTPISSRNSSPHPPSTGLAARTTTARAPLYRQPSVRIRRLQSQQLPQHQHIQFDSTARTDSAQAGHGGTRPDLAATGRRRSSSDPQPALGHTVPPQSNGLARVSTGLSGLPTLREESSQPENPSSAARGPAVAPPSQRPGMIQRASTAAMSVLGRRQTGRYEDDQASTAAGSAAGQDNQEYGEDMVNILDAVDPQVATLSTLTNVQNSLFVPNLGKYLDRRPTYTLLRDPTMTRTTTQAPLDRPPSAAGSQTGHSTHLQPISEAGPGSGQQAPGLQRSQTTDTITSVMNDKHYAVLPHGVSLDNWTAEEKAELDDHVRHMLHSRRSKMKRRWKAFGQYVRNPLGFLITLYATLITLFGLAWVLFLIGWINVGGRQIYIVHVIDSVLVALFGVVGYGLAPFRAVDTYHMIYIAHYHRLTWRLRRERNLPDLHDKNDLPEGEIEGENPLANRNTATIVATTGMEMDLEAGLAKRKSTSAANLGKDEKKKGLRLPGWMIRVKNVFRKPVEEVEGITRKPLTHENSNNGPNVEKKQRSSSEDDTADLRKSTSSASTDDYDNEHSVLTPKQQAKLVHHQTIFARSHTFYKPHETFTHYAFPLWILILVVVLLDCHSLLQFSLGATTWGIYYKNRHEAITSVILSCSITVNITAGIMISVGDKKSRKKDVVDRLSRQELTSEAIQHLERKRRKRIDNSQKAAEQGVGGVKHSSDGVGNSKADSSLKAEKPVMRDERLDEKSRGRTE